MSIDEVIEAIEGLGGVLTLRPRPGDGSPEISWGDAFCYYAPDGVVPRTQPFATIVTNDHPGDEGSRRHRLGAFRVNVAAGTEEFRRWTGRDPREPVGQDIDPSTPDVLFTHPCTAAWAGWPSSTRALGRRSPSADCSGRPTTSPVPATGADPDQRTFSRSRACRPG